MQEFFIKLLEYFVKFNDWLFSPVDGFVEKMPLSDWVLDAVLDSIHMLGFLFVVFLVIELIEFYYSGKMYKIVSASKKSGPILGALAASVPQCGFSMIASTLYTKKLITRGTLLAVYLATSDEALPVLLSEPEKLSLVLPLVFTKIAIALIAGYSVDFFLKNDKTLPKTLQDAPEDEHGYGCCNHEVGRPRKRDILLHPVMHTLNVFIFVLIITLLINYGVFRAGGEENLGHYFLSDSIFQPVITALFGLIPNCAVSIAITLMLMKGAIGFGSAIAGLCSGAGLGLLVLYKKNSSFKDSLKITGILLLISIISGILIQTFYY